MKRVVLLGGGHAHLHVLQALAREPLAGARPVLITPHAHLTYSGMVPGAVAGHYTPDQARIPLLPLCEAARVSLVCAQATALDAQERVVTLSDGRVAEYDVLSLDVGGTQDRSALPGACKHALFVRPVEPFVEQMDRLHARAGPPLALNLRGLVGAGALQPYTPRRRTLNLLSCGERRAIMAWGDWAAEGRWVWWWKDRIDRGFVRRFLQLNPWA